MMQISSEISGIESLRNAGIAYQKSEISNYRLPLINLLIKINDKIIHNFMMELERKTIFKKIDLFDVQEYILIYFSFSNIQTKIRNYQITE